MICTEHNIKYDKFDQNGFALEGYCQVCDKKFDEYKKEIKADIIEVKTARIEEIIEEFKNDESDNCDDIRKDIIEMLENLKKGN